MTPPVDVEQSIPILTDAIIAARPALRELPELIDATLREHLGEDRS